MDRDTTVTGILMYLITRYLVMLIIHPSRQRESTKSGDQESDVAKSRELETMKVNHSELEHIKNQFATTCTCNTDDAIQVQKTYYLIITIPLKLIILHLYDKEKITKLEKENQWIFFRS